MRPMLQVVAEARTGHEALIRARLSDPDLPILAYSVPGSNGSDLTLKLCEVLPSIRVLIYTMYCSESIVRDVIGAPSCPVAKQMLSNAQKARAATRMSAFGCRFSRSLQHMGFAKCPKWVGIGP